MKPAHAVRRKSLAAELRGGALGFLGCGLQPSHPEAGGWRGQAGPDLGLRPESY